MVEYGEIDPTPGIFDPPDSPPRAPTFDYNITIPGLLNRTLTTTTGKTLGGSSSVNGQFFDRGSRFDYDDWAELAGNSSGGIKWDWDGLFPYFKKSVTFVEPTEQQVKDYDITWDKAAYGGSTPIYSSFPTFQWPSARKHRSRPGTVWSS